VAQLLAVRALWDAARAASPDPAGDWQLTASAGELAALFAQCDRAQESLAMFEAAIAAYERLVRDHANVLTYRSRLATARSEHGAALLSRWRFDEGLRVVVQAEKDHEAALALAADDVTALVNAAFAAISLAQAH